MGKPISATLSILVVYCYFTQFLSLCNLLFPIHQRLSPKQKSSSSVAFLGLWLCEFHTALEGCGLIPGV